MLTPKKIEDLYLQCFASSKDGGTWHNHQKFARLVEAEVLTNASRVVAGEVAHGGRVMLNCELLSQRASAARRAAKEGR